MFKSSENKHDTIYRRILSRLVIFEGFAAYTYTRAVLNFPPLIYERLLCIFIVLVINNVCRIRGTSARTGEPSTALYYIEYEWNLTRLSVGIIIVGMAGGGIWYV